MKFVQDISQLPTNETFVFTGYQAPFGVKFIEVTGQCIGEQVVSGFPCVKIKLDVGVVIFLRQDALMYCELESHVTMIKCA